MKYNYVIFNSVPTDVSYNREEDYYVICLKDLENRDDIILNHVPLQEQPRWLRRLYNFHHSRWLYNKYWKFPFESLWNPLIFKNTFRNDKPICFICLRYPSINYLQYLKKKYPDCKIVKMSRDLIKIQKRRYEDYTKAKIFDIWMSFDKQDCEKYGFPHFDEFESKVDIPIEKDYPIADVFFAGQAKDRLGRLVKIYDKLEKEGLNCYFFITNAKDKIERKGIVYSSESMTYVQMLKKSVNSKCILEISQENAIGYTSRFLEAVMFNKLLITDNESIKTTKFYNPDYIQIIKSEDDLEMDFIKNSEKVNYFYSNEFSPIKRIELIEELLSR